jgi:hypothetical protein
MVKQEHFLVVKLELVHLALVNYDIQALLRITVVLILLKISSPLSNLKLLLSLKIVADWQFLFIMLVHVFFLLLITSVCVDQP